FAYADRASNFLGHRTNVRGDFWRFGDECGVDIEDARSFVGKQFRHSFQNLDAADAAKRLIRIWKMPADVARADRAPQRIRDRMRQNIRVRVSFQPVRVWNLNAAQNQLSSLRETMDVVTDAGSNHGRQSFKSITPFEATMLYLSFMFSRGRRSTVPPAFSTRSPPAAMSHKLIPVSMYASNRPQATYAMSSAALPSTRHLRTR